VPPRQGNVRGRGSERSGEELSGPHDLTHCIERRNAGSEGGVNGPGGLSGPHDTHTHTVRRNATTRRTGGTLQVLDPSSVDVDRVSGDGGRARALGDGDWQPHDEQRAVLRPRLHLHLRRRVRQLCNSHTPSSTSSQ